MQYMGAYLGVGAYPGVGACPGHYGITKFVESKLAIVLICFVLLYLLPGVVPLAFSQ